MEEKRKFIRVKVRLLTSLVKHDGAYELIEEAAKPTPTLIEVKDISTGGLCLQSECEFLKGASLEPTMPISIRWLSLPGSIDVHPPTNSKMSLMS